MQYDIRETTASNDPADRGTLLRTAGRFVEAQRIAALEAENATLRAALNTAEGTVEGCRNMLVEYGTAQAYGVDFRQELTTLLASIRAALAGEKGA